MAPKSEKKKKKIQNMYKRLKTVRKNHAATNYFYTQYRIPKNM